jgi:hypothetical protein
VSPSCGDDPFGWFEDPLMLSSWAFDMVLSIPLVSG